MRGETLIGVDVKVTNVGGREVVLNVGGAPIRDQLGLVTGCVEVFRDVTARNYQEQRTRDTLGAPVAMAEAIVQIRPTSYSAEEAGHAPSSLVADVTLPHVARRLAELTRSVLGCRRVSIVAMHAATGRLDPVTEVGLSPAQAQQWWASWSAEQSLEERYGVAIAANLYAGEPALLDAGHLPEESRYTLFQAATGRIVPMQLGEELVGRHPGRLCRAGPRLFQRGRGAAAHDAGPAGCPWCWNGIGCYEAGRRRVPMNWRSVKPRPRWIRSWASPATNSRLPSPR